jgi:hypothetical protein
MLFSSSRQIGDNMKKKKRGIDLSRLFNFTDDDLKANRNGKISDRQKRLLLLYTVTRTEFLWFALGGIPILGVLIWLMVRPAGLKFPVLLAIMLLVVGIILTIDVMKRIVALIRDLSEGTVQHLDSYLTTRRRVERKSGIGLAAFHEVVVSGAKQMGGQTTLRISRRQFDALPESGYYEFYYAPHTGRILSIQEAVSADYQPKNNEVRERNVTSGNATPNKDDEFTIEGNPFAPIFKFNEADLEMNRLGWLTDEQSARLPVQLRWKGGIGSVQRFEGTVTKATQDMDKGIMYRYWAFKSKRGNFRDKFTLPKDKYDQLDDKYKDVIVYVTNSEGRFIASVEFA